MQVVGVQTRPAPRPPSLSKAVNADPRVILTITTVHAALSAVYASSPPLAPPPSISSPTVTLLRQPRWHYRTTSNSYVTRHPLPYRPPLELVPHRQGRCSDADHPQSPRTLLRLLSLIRLIRPIGRTTNFLSRSVRSTFNDRPLTSSRTRSIARTGSILSIGA